MLLCGADLDLECLATWKDGSESYLYSRLTSTSSSAAAAVTNEDGNQYRCLVHTTLLPADHLMYTFHHNLECITRE